MFCTLIQISLRFVPQSVLVQVLVSIGSGNGLAPNRCQAITWNNNDPVHWCTYRSPDKNVSCGMDIIITGHFLSLVNLLSIQLHDEAKNKKNTPSSELLSLHAWAKLPDRNADKISYSVFSSPHQFSLHVTKIAITMCRNIKDTQQRCLFSLTDTSYFEIKHSYSDLVCSKWHCTWVILFPTSKSMS